MLCGRRQVTLPLWAHFPSISKRGRRNYLSRCLKTPFLCLFDVLNITSSKTFHRPPTSVSRVFVYVLAGCVSHTLGFKEAGTVSTLLQFLSPGNTRISLVLRWKWELLKDFEQTFSRLKFI